MQTPIRVSKHIKVRVSVRVIGSSMNSWNNKKLSRSILNVVNKHGASMSSIDEWS